MNNYPHAGTGSRLNPPRAARVFYISDCIQFLILLQRLQKKGKNHVSVAALLMMQPSFFCPSQGLVSRSVSQSVVGVCENLPLCFEKSTTGKKKNTGLPQFQFHVMMYLSRKKTANSLLEDSNFTAQNFLARSGTSINTATNLGPTSKVCHHTLTLADPVSQKGDAAAPFN